MNKQTKTKVNPRSMTIYQPNELQARRGNTQLARRENYSITPAADYEVLDGLVVYRPEKQAEPKRERKPFDLVNTVKWLVAWTVVGAVISGFLFLKTLPQGIEQMGGVLDWINNALLKTSLTLWLAAGFEGFLLALLTNLFGGNKKEEK